jgi:hypothetical protein
LQFYQRRPTRLERLSPPFDSDSEDFTAESVVIYASRGTTLHLSVVCVAHADMAAVSEAGYVNILLNINFIRTFVCSE